jgi:hypothetical protein
MARVLRGYAINEWRAESDVAILHGGGVFRAQRGVRDYERNFVAAD